MAAALGETDTQRAFETGHTPEHAIRGGRGGCTVQMSFTHHWSFKMSRHIAPVTELILGCQILLMNRTLKKTQDKCYTYEGVGGGHTYFLALKSLF